MITNIGKLIDGELIFPDNSHPTVVDGENVWSCEPDFLLNHGWKNVIYSDSNPPEGYFTSGCLWEESSTDITQIWEYDQLPTKDENNPTETDRITALEEAILDIAPIIGESQIAPTVQDRTNVIEYAVMELAELVFDLTQKVNLLESERADIRNKANSAYNAISNYLNDINYPYNTIDEEEEVDNG